MGPKLYSKATRILPSRAGAAKSMGDPMIRVTVENWNVYLYLNRTDQGALSSGGAAGLGALICAAITAAGTVAGLVGCAVVSGVLVTGAYYIAANGICGNELRLALWNGADGGAPRCV